MQVRVMVSNFHVVDGSWFIVHGKCQSLRACPVMHRTCIGINHGIDFSTLVGLFRRPFKDVCGPSMRLAFRRLRNMSHAPELSRISIRTNMWGWVGEEGHVILARSLAEIRRLVMIVLGFTSFSLFSLDGI